MKTNIYLAVTSENLGELKKLEDAHAYSRLSSTSDNMKTELSDLEMVRIQVADAKKENKDYILILNDDVTNINSKLLERDFTEDLIVFNYDTIQSEKIVPFSCFEQSMKLNSDSGFYSETFMKRVGAGLFNKIFKVEILEKVLDRLSELKCCNLFTDLIVTELFLFEAKSINFIAEKLCDWNSKNFITNKKFENLLELNSQLCLIPETLNYMDKVHAELGLSIVDYEAQAEFIINDLLQKLLEQENPDGYFEALLNIIPEQSLAHCIIFSSFDDEIKITCLKKLEAAYFEKN